MSACPLAIVRPASDVARPTADEAAGARGPDVGLSHAIATAHTAYISQIALRLVDIVASVDRVRVQVAPRRRRERAHDFQSASPVLQRLRERADHSGF